MQRSVTLVVASAALSWVGADASPHKLDFTRRAVAQILDYDLTGCYTEAANMRALSGSAYFDDSMTIEKCANACTGFKHFGVEYGRECYCGNNINDGSVEAPLADCSFACPGDSSESCGAGNRLNLYTRTTDPAVPSRTVYSSRGCYAEPSNGRALTSQATRADDMTVAKCATFCGNAGYTLFGLEYYTECYCANVLTPGAVPADATDCNFPCAGDSAEVCGGDWRLNLYEFSIDSPPVSTSATTSSSAVSTQEPTTYTNEGCYTEAKGIRALSDVAYYDDAMTVEKCAAACAGYTWFGVEYGRECYGGNTIHSAEGSALTSPSECNFPCAGNPSEKCGAGDRLNVYRFLPPAATSSTSTLTATSSDASVETSRTATTETASSATSTAIPTVPATSTISASVSSTSTPDSATSSLNPDPTSTPTTVVDQVTTSTTTSSSAAATTSSQPTVIEGISNGGFEGSGGWTIKTTAPGLLAYSFVDTNDPHNGLRSASIAYSAGAAAYQGWFTQLLTLKANTRYNFSGWTKSCTANPGCSVSYYIGTSNGNQDLKTMAQATSANLKPNWIQSTGFYDTGATTQFSFNVRLTCSGSAARTYYFDDLSLLEASTS